MGEGPFCSPRENIQLFKFVSTQTSTLWLNVYPLAKIRPAVVGQIGVPYKYDMLKHQKYYSARVLS